MPRWLRICPVREYKAASKRHGVCKGVGLTPLERKLNAGLKSSFLTGLTLIEMLIVSAIFSVAAIAIYTTFASGMSVWRRVQDVSFFERKVLLGLEKISCELRQSLDLSDIGFEGNKEQITFAVLINGEICKVGYSFDPVQKAILRRESRLADILEGRISQPIKFISPAGGFHLRYLAFDAEKNEHTWIDDWQDKESLPLAVEIRLESQDEVRESTVLIPRG